LRQAGGGALKFILGAVFCGAGWAIVVMALHTSESADAGFEKVRLDRLSLSWWWKTR
jgi:hypothetical protein